jgi:hypothetical protein
MHLTVILILMPAIGAPYYGPLSLRADLGALWTVSQVLEEEIEPCTW